MAEVICKKKSINPNEVVHLSEENNKYIEAAYQDTNHRWIQIGPKKYVFLERIQNSIDKFYDFKVRPDDIWIVTLPRSGTTLTQEMVWQIQNFDLNTNLLLIERFPYLEMADKIDVNDMLQTHKDNPAKCKEIKRMFGDDAWKKIENNPSPRFIKTHMPLSLLPPELSSSGCKVIYVARNPKDMLVSRYKFNQGGLIKHTNFEEFYNLYERDLGEYNPIWEHIQEGWMKRNDENFLFLFYEEIVSDLKSTIKKVSKFLGTNLTEDQMSQIAEHLKVENFKNNKSVNRDHIDYVGGKDADFTFVRKGKVGAWNELFTDELNERVNKWIEENYKKTDLRFVNSK